MAKQKKQAVEAPKVEAKTKCPECGREFKSALAVAIHAGQVHKKAKAGKPKAVPTGGGCIPVEVADRPVTLTFAVPLSKLAAVLLALGRLGVTGAKIDL